MIHYFERLWLFAAVIFLVNASQVVLPAARVAPYTPTENEQEAALFAVSSLELRRAYIVALIEGSDRFHQMTAEARLDRMLCFLECGALSVSFSNPMNGDTLLHLIIRHGDDDFIRVISSIQSSILNQHFTQSAFLARNNDGKTPADCFSFWTEAETRLAFAMWQASVFAPAGQIDYCTVS